MLNNLNQNILYLMRKKFDFIKGSWADDEQISDKS